jgi:SAM-dependent methyltransferase
MKLMENFRYDTNLGNAVPADLATPFFRIGSKMAVMQNLLVRAFGRPQGLLGKLGGVIMARMNADFGLWVIDLLEIKSGDRVLEVGFGPGVVIQRLSQKLPAGRVAGIDGSSEMVAQACARNALGVESGHIELRQGLVDGMPFSDNSFDKALAVNSMQVWPDPVAGLREILRVMIPGGRVALGFSVHSGQVNRGLAETLIAAGFENPQVVESKMGFCALATRP